jgi:hypothetical protein
MSKLIFYYLIAAIQVKSIKLKNVNLED